MRKISVISRAVLLATAFMLVAGIGNLAYGARPNNQNENVLTVQVFLGGGTFDLRADANGRGPFYVGGAIVDPNTGQTLGEFQCWGWFFEADRNMVNQEYNLFDRGKIILTGEEDGGIRPITGGAGDFRNVRGEATFDFSNLSVDGSFLASFHLIGADAD